jgi:AcrR family transcriptional regulator
MNQDSNMTQSVIFLGDGQKAPKTKRGAVTRHKLLDAAEAEFGEKGYHEGSIAEITRRAGVALGTFYVYFDSKEAVFRALVAHMGHLTRAHIAQRVEGAPDRLAAERIGLLAFLEFARTHTNLYRIVMESQFVAEDAYRDYYTTFAGAYRRNLSVAVQRGEIRDGDAETRAWALIGLSVFLGMRYGAWDSDTALSDVVDGAFDLIAHGLAPSGGSA